jgi:hypothetical protein
MLIKMTNTIYELYIVIDLGFDSIIISNLVVVA